MTNVIEIHTDGKDQEPRSALDEIRLEDDRLCTLVLIGVREDGSKELIAVEDVCLVIIG